MTAQPQPEAAPELTPPTVADLPPELAERAAGVSDIVLGIPMGRWLRIVRRFDMSQDDILGDFTALLIVAANEKARGERGGRDQWEWVEAMNLREMQTYLGIREELPAEEHVTSADAPDHPPAGPDPSAVMASAEVELGPKSDALVGGAGGPAVGGGTGAAPAPSPDLPGAGPEPV